MSFMFYDEAESHQPFLEALLEAHHSEKPNDRTERLRRFLSFCLAIDYELTAETPDKLTKEDLCIFVHLARRCFLERRRPTEGDMIRGNPYRYSYLKPRDVVAKDPVVQAELMEPAMALGIPCSVVIVMLRCFISSMRLRRMEYKSQIVWLRVQTSLDNIAARSFMDRHILLDALLPLSSDATAFRQVMALRMDQSHGARFKALRSPTDYTTTAYGDWILRTEKARQRASRPPPYSGARFDCKRAATMVKCVVPSKDDSWRVKLLRMWVNPRQERLCKTSEDLL
jgi:hypothetical protein